MKVYQIRLKLYLLQNLPVENCQSKITGFIDRLLCSQEEFLALHKENQYKNYCFDYLYKIEVDKIYKLLNVDFDSYAGESFYNDKMAPIVEELKEKKLLKI